MTEDDDKYIPLRKLFSEKLARDIILFGLLFVMTLSQDWPNILLLLFPLVTFSFSLFFTFIDRNKRKSSFDKSNLRYNPLGSERKHSDRFSFSALLQIAILFWYGAESIYHPQLVDNYFLYFMIIFHFIYAFTFYWVFIDLWLYARVEVILFDVEIKETQYKDEKFVNQIESFLSMLSIKKFRQISMISFLIFIILTIFNILFTFYITIDPTFGLEYSLPGTGIEDSEPIILHYFVFAILVIPPAISALFFKQVYQSVNDISQSMLETVLSALPRNIQFQIVENLKALNKKLFNSFHL